MRYFGYKHTLSSWMHHPLYRIDCSTTSRPRLWTLPILWRVHLLMAKIIIKGTVRARFASLFHTARSVNSVIQPCLGFECSSKSLYRTIWLVSIVLWDENLAMGQGNDSQEYVFFDRGIESIIRRLQIFDTGGNLLESIDHYNCLYAITELWTRCA